MNANVMTGLVAEADEHELAVAFRAAELAQINESLQRRERLLAASAQASRLLLQASDVMAAVPEVLRQIGEAANVDRVNLMLSQPGPNGEWLLVVASEWVAEGVVPHLGHPTMGKHDERDFARECAELRAGRSVCINKHETTSTRACDGCGGGGCVLDGVGTKTQGHRADLRRRRVRRRRRLRQHAPAAPDRFRRNCPRSKPPPA